MNTYPLRGLIVSALLVNEHRTAVDNTIEDRGDNVCDNCVNTKTNTIMKKLT